ncbi:hypothetical protein ACFSTC_47600 [Nonomuraea ferruginea]
MLRARTGEGDRQRRVGRDAASDARLQIRPERLDRPASGHRRAPHHPRGGNSTIQRDPAADAFRLFTVNSDFNLDRVKLLGGDARTSPGGFGGAVAVNSGTTNLNRVFIRNNTATFSGGLGGVAGAVVNVSNSNIQNNTATRNGGGAANDGRMTFIDTVVNNNRAGEKGGGIASDGILVVTGSVVNDNTA